ncbi:MAG TPA: cystathionine beta-lyase [Burkholderiaceae bacterium]|nr:cystathionine beta-lyase [Burkholderiaceae bacterium]
MAHDERRFETKLLHSDRKPPSGFESLTTPLHHASTVVFPSVAEMRARTWDRDDCYSYGLRGTPTTAELELQLAQIEGATHCLLTPGGLAAIAMIDFALLKAGDEVLLPDNVYQPSRDLAHALLGELGVKMRVYDAMMGARIAELLSPATRLVWLEAPGSVTMEVPDVRAIVGAVKARGITTAIDNTWSAGVTFKPLELGIDIAMQALTKYQSGGSDVLMGAALTRDRDLHLKMKFTHMRLGLGVGPDDAYLVTRGLKSLAVRFERHDASARAVARWCAQVPEMVRVLHPALPSCPGHEYWMRDFSGAGGLFSVVFDERIAANRIDAFVDALRVFKIGYSWGGAVSLAVPYRIDDARAARLGRGGLVRFAIGLEAPEDLIADIDQALRAVR